MPASKQEHHGSFNSVPNIILEEITLCIIIRSHTLKSRSTITELIILPVDLSLRLNHRVQFSDMIKIAVVSGKISYASLSLVFVAVLQNGKFFRCHNNNTYATSCSFT